MNLLMTACVGATRLLLVEAHTTPDRSESMLPGCNVKLTINFKV